MSSGKYWGLPKFPCPEPIEILKSATSVVNKQTNRKKYLSLWDRGNANNFLTLQDCNDKCNATNDNKLDNSHRCSMARDEVSLFIFAPSLSIICHPHPWMSSMDKVSPSMDDIHRWHFYPWMRFFHQWMTSIDDTSIHVWDLLIHGWNCHLSDFAYVLQRLGQFWLKLVIYVSKMWQRTIPYMD